MNRLTGRDELGYYAPLECMLNCLKHRGDVIDRLAEYEDTGLSPEDIRELRKLVDFDQLKELLKAKAEERLVVLPRKVGDTVWVAGEKRVIKCEIDEAYLDDVKGLEFLVSFNCEYLEQGGDYCNGCPFYSWHQNYSGEWDCDNVWGNASVKGADFGKTVFLSREEAEAALKAKEETDHDKTKL